MTESEEVDLLVELFRWDVEDQQARYHALTLLRGARGEPLPTWDDFRAGVSR